MSEIDQDVHEECYTNTIQLKVFRKKMIPKNNLVLGNEHFINLKIYSNEKVSLDINVIHEPFWHSNNDLQIEDIITFLLKSPYVRGNFEIPKSLLK